MSIDYVGLHQNLINNSLQYATWHNEICKLAKLGGISQVWSDSPAWYFWITETKGAYLFRMIDEEAYENFSVGTFLLHYFPESESDLNFLSNLERSLLQNKKKFDQKTNTPDYDHLEEFYDHFILSELKIMLTDNGELQLLTYSSLDIHNDKTDIFANMLILILNFYTKKTISHSYWGYLSEILNTNIVSYEPNVFEIFCSIYDLDKSSFTDNIENKNFENWQLVSKIRAVCTSKSTCSCGSH